MTSALAATTQRSCATFSTSTRRSGRWGHLANWLFLTRHMRKFLLVRNETLKAVAESDRWRRYLPAP